VTITRPIYKDLLLNKVLPAIKTLWPPGEARAILVQQDNAQPHVPPTDPDVLLAGHEGDWHIDLVCQPPNSPETNVLDLGFFRALQSNQVKRGARTVDDIIKNVNDAWAAVPHTTLLNNWKTLQLIMLEIIVCGGNNTFKLPHAGKAKLARVGRLPEQPVADPAVVGHAVASLNEDDEAAFMASLEAERHQVAENDALCAFLEELEICSEIDLENMDNSSSDE